MRVTDAAETNLVEIDMLVTADAITQVRPPEPGNCQTREGPVNDALTSPYA
ncbi:hypothetical protein ACFT1A_18100 [Rhodococcus sp. NPDC057135]|uniref:hypothetical protein n=1 Tax=Rhodococcus sp. NPDC057135 TaxID=3346028 RepID=UPI00362CFE16